MKIAAIIDNSIGVGGGFDQALNAIMQMQRLCHGRYEFIVYTSRANNVSVLNSLGVKALVFKYTIHDRVISKLSDMPLWRMAQMRSKRLGPMERNLIAHGVDLVYFVTPGNAPLCLQRLSFITTIWDLAHRDAPEFPEIREYGVFQERENAYRSVLPAAYLALTDSEQLAESAGFRYGVDRERFLPMPFGASPMLNQGRSLSAQEVRQKYNLKSNYFYYPAQFWPHKNHIRIIEALCILRERHSVEPTVVFSGKDMGNLDWVRSSIRKNNLESQVSILGFVPSDEVRGLYEGAVAVVMPTYFGPTNLPPLEAWSIGTPLIYSVQFSEQVDDAAKLVDPDDPHSIANAMLYVQIDENRAQLVDAGKRRLKDIETERQVAEQQFLRKLEQFSRRLVLWRPLESK